MARLGWAFGRMEPLATRGARVTFMQKGAVHLPTAICVSIDRFLQNRAPNGCLPFDCIGARHPGIPVVTTGAHTDFSGLSTRSLAHTSAYKVTNDLGSAVIASSGFVSTGPPPGATRDEVQNRSDDNSR